jgi:PAS domain S-box-containing protein
MALPQHVPVGEDNPDDAELMARSRTPSVPLSFTRRNPRLLWRVALIVAAYLLTFILLDFISQQFEELRGIVAWYPSVGLTYALLLVFGARFTPAVTLALLIDSLFIYRMPQPPYLLFLWALIISLIYGLAAAFLRRRTHFDWRLRKSRDVTWLVSTAVFVSALLAMLSVSSSALSSDMPRSEVLRSIFVWWIGETVGVLTITPFLLFHVAPWLKRFAEGQPVRLPARRPLPRLTFSVIGQAFSLAVVFYWVFGARGLDEFRPLYLVSLPLIWIALDHGFKGATTGIVVLNFGVTLAMWLSRLDLARLGELQLLMIVSCIVGLLMGAVVTERKQAEESTQRSAEELIAINTLGRVLAETLDTRQIFNLLGEAVWRLLPDISILFISRFDSQKELITCLYARMDEELLDPAELPPIPLEARGVGTQSEAIHTRKPIIINDLRERLKRVKTQVEVGTDDGRVTQSGLYIPMLAKERVIGVIQVQSYSLDRFTEKDAELLGLAANTASVAIENARLFAELQVERNSLARERTLLRVMIDNMPDFIYAKDTQGRFLVANVAVARGMGAAAPEELLGKTDADFYPQEFAARYLADEQGLMRSGQALFDREEPVPGAGGAPRWLSTTKVPWRDSLGNIVGLVGLGHDITARKQMEEEQKKLQGQLAQAQKMEAIGQLAGGVAHDFNNMLQAILGNAEMALGQVDPTQPLHGDLQDIIKAAQHSADLTRQLLAFARRQTIAPQVLDLNDAIEGMLKMLRRLIGEDINLAWLPHAGLWPVKMDPSQVDQLLANLCVNARDAIGGVGKVTIETSRAVFDQAYCRDHAGAVPGEYALLAVSDDGCGMDKETLERIFEPFFTTKAQGQGTGMGLATVYGIVKQNNGYINVYSEPGKGATFRIYLPCHVGQMAEEAATAARTPRGGHETILLVEDEPAILQLGKRMLEGVGYTVLTAGLPSEAVRLAGEHASEIQLLITDVVMPGMSGRVLAERLRASRPEMKCLFMSGYTANAIAHRGVLETGVHFLQKPFSRSELTDKVRETLEWPG